MAEVTFEDVSKIYGDGTRAVNDLDLEIQNGEFMVLVGPSGCGKSTALRMVAGLEEISEGELRIGARVVNEVPSRDRDIAMVFQSYALYPHLTVYDNIAFSLRLKKVPKQEIDKRVRDAARILGLEQFLERKPRALSGGQRQRVAMGRAIVREPQAFLMDEPLSNLDAKLRVQMRAEILRIQQSVGVTTMYVTHDQTEAMTLGDKVAVLKKGLLQQVASPQELYRRPANLFVAGFIGSPAMNLVEATITGADGDLFSEFAGNRLRIDNSITHARPALRAYDGRRVVLGIRPEEMEDASLVPETPEDQRIPARIDIREDMGSEIYIHFIVDAPPVLTEDTKELAVDAGTDVLEQLEENVTARQSVFVARFDNESKADVSDRVEVAINPAGLHFFDLQTGDAIYDRVPEAAGR